jgi:small-conductance mechanosensitive channel
MEQMSKVMSYFSHSEFLSGLVAFSILIFIRHLIVRSVFKLQFSKPERKQKWMRVARTVTFLVLVLIFVLMWGQELRSLAISLAAVAVALVLALKEVIVSMIGGLVKASYKLFEVGDRITVGEIRGQVIDHNLYMTTLFEIGPGSVSNQFTGRQVKIPNSVFITENFTITPAGNHYTLHIMVVPVALDKDIFIKQEILKKCAEAVCAPYFSVAEEYITNMCLKQAVVVPEIKPRVFYQVKSPKIAEFHVRIPVPFKTMARTENKLQDMYLSELFKKGLG